MECPASATASGFRLSSAMRAARSAGLVPIRLKCIRGCRKLSRTSASLRGSSRYRRNDDVPRRDEASELSLAALDGSSLVTFGSWSGRLTHRNMVAQLWRIMTFAGPALGIWLFSPVMSLIDTAVIGNSSTMELAALAPGTVLCDYVSYMFMFLSVATSNLVANSLARNDEVEAGAHLSRLLLISLICGTVMLAGMEIYTVPFLSRFLTQENASLISPAATYVKIRALSWPPVLVGMVAQSAILGMQDSWSPLKVLAIAGALNAVGDVFLCTYLGFGIAGAAWATSFAQYVAALLMLRSLSEKGYNVFSLRVPSMKDVKQLLKIVVPVLSTTLFEVAFYTMCTYLATSLGAISLAAHQVMMGIHSLCYVWGEPLAQTAQTFMPALISGGSWRDLREARVLLLTLLFVGASVGLVAGCSAISIPWLMPQIFTSDVVIIEKMRGLTLPVLFIVLVTPPMLALEGTLLAGRDLKFLGFAMVFCYACGTVALLTFHKAGFGLPGYWWALFLIEMSRFLVALGRLTSPRSVLADKESSTSRHLKADDE